MKTRTSYPPEAILLDFYGTIVHEDGVLVRQISEQIAYASPLPVTSAEVSAFWGHVFRQLCATSFGAAFKTQRQIERLSLEKVLQRLDAQLDGDALAASLYAAWVQPVLFAESQEFVDKCPLPICLVSNIDNADLEQALRHTRLRFDYIVTSEDCRAYKPRREVFDRAIELLGLPPKRLLHVGDSIRADVLGAKETGIPVMWINRAGRHWTDGSLVPDYTAENLWGLIERLELVPR